MEERCLDLELTVDEEVPELLSWTFLVKNIVPDEAKKELN